jgi:hypothetical protein
MPTDHASIVRHLGHGLRREASPVTRAPLPKRWVDLIKRLNEMEWAERNAAASEKIRIDGRMRKPPSAN